MRNSGLALILVLFSYSFALSQVNYANRLYEENDFETAAKVYEKVIEKDSTDIVSIERLADCYKRLNKYDRAEELYARAVTFENCDPEDFLNYGQLLKNNNKIRQARQQFLTYVQKKPESLLGKILLQSCEDISVWASEPTEFQLKNLKAVNTEYLEMSPIPYGNKLLFTSDKNYIDKEGKEGKHKKSLDGEVLGIYIYDSTDKEIPIRSISPDINSTDNIEGPAYLSSGLDQLFYTKVYSRQRYQVNQMELHMAHLEGEKWVKDEDYKYNSKNYSITNPVVSPDGKFLYFASDMPGGLGGFDLYVSDKTEDGYTEPVNLGNVINTPGNEIPSYIDETGTFYFSSNFHPGFGGLDVFKSSKTANGWSTPVNIKSPFNSSKDDLGYILIDSLSGYFASNRDGGMGLDDIYYFYKLRFTDSSYYTDISGLFTYDTLPLINMSLALLDENDEIVQMVTTNERGEFTFKNVPSDKSYKILIDESPEKVPEDAKIYLTNDRYQKIMLIERVQKGLFKFETLKRDEYAGLSLMDEVDDEGRPTLNVIGQLHNNVNDTAVGGRIVYVIDENGNVLASTVSDHLGKFNFQKLSLDEEYLFKLEENDPDIDIRIISEKGKVLGRTVKNKDGIYVYHKFTINPSDQPDIRGLFKYGNLPADNVLLMLMDENDEIVQITETNIKGEFEFKGLNSGKTYRIKVDSTLKIPSNASMFLMDKHTGTLMPVSKLANGSFSFNTLAPMSPPELALMEEDDYVIKPMHDLTGQVYRQSGNKVKPGIEVQLQDVNGSTIAVAKTDEMGKFNFFNLPVEDQYLFGIPEDDPDLQIRVINGENATVGLTERNDKNQFVYHKFTINPSKRPDIRGVFKYGSLPANDVALNLMDEDDHLVQITKTDKQGGFKFTKLEAGKAYRIEVDSNEQVPDNANMLLMDEMTGLMLPVSKLSNGSFKFETLAPMESGELAFMEEKDDSAVRFAFFAQLFNKLPLELPEGLKVELVDDEGNVIAIAVTDKFGRFNYEKLPLADEYLMRIVEDDPNYAIRIITEEGEELGVLQRNKKGEFVFRPKSTGKEVAAVKGGTNGKSTEDKKPATDRDDNSASTAKTDVKPADQSAAAKVVSEGPAVHYDFESLAIDGDSRATLHVFAQKLKTDPTLKIEIASHTDSWGAADYNLWLSEQRSEAVKKTLMDMGIDENRIKTIGYGETRLLNECADGVKCPKEKHAQNRRSELTLYR